jgi:hypothetical protein
MIGIPKTPGTWRQELKRSQQSLSAVNRFWAGLYGKALINPSEALPDSPPDGADDAAGSAPSPAPARSMYERVGSRVTHT